MEAARELGESYHQPFDIETWIMKHFLGIALLLLGMAVSLRAESTGFASITAKPRWPWNGLVDITFTIPNFINATGDKPVFPFQLKGYDHSREKLISLHTLSFDGNTFMFRQNGDFSAVSGRTYNMIWDASKDYPALNTSAFSISLVSAQPSEKPFDVILLKDGHIIVDGMPMLNGKLMRYIVVDLVSGDYRFQEDAPDLSDDVCRTTELWLRWIPAGTFTMGSPVDELGRYDDEVQHEVTKPING